MKKRFLLWFGNFLIWVVPVVLTLAILIDKYYVMQREKPLKFRIEFWFAVALIIMAIIYWKKGKEIIEKHLMKAFVLDKKANPLWVFLNSLLAILPFYAIIIIYKALVCVNENLIAFLNTLLYLQIGGRLCLVFDSLKGEKEDGN